MKYKPFGKTGLNISAMTLGTWGMGGSGWDVYDDEVKMDAIKAAVEQGINLIDTAPAYNAGASERFVGEALEKLGVRDEIYISTKCGNYFKDNQYLRDGSFDFVRQQCDESLQNLHTDHIDVMLIHWPDPKVSFEETMDALKSLKKEGKILHIGISNFSIEQMKEISQYGDVEVYQPPYSMVNLSAEENIRWATKCGMGIMSYGSLGGGILTGKIRQHRDYDPGDNRNRFYKMFEEPNFSKAMALLQVMDEVSARNGNIPLSQIALNWSYEKPFISTCIVGAQKRERVLENAQSFEASVDPEDLKLLDEYVREHYM